MKMSIGKIIAYVNHRFYRIFSGIDARRGQNVAILMASCRKSEDQLVEDIVHCKVNDAKYCSVLAGICPSDQEQQLLREFDGPVEQLAMVDHFYYTLSKLNLVGLDRKFRVLNYLMQHNTNRDSIPILVKLTEALKTLRSDTFTKLMSLVLSIVNFCIGSGNRQGTYGFNLEDLSHLKQMRTQSEYDMNMNEYIGKIIQNHYPHWKSSILNDMKQVLDLTVFSLPEIPDGTYNPQNATSFSLTQLDNHHAFYSLLPQQIEKTTASVKLYSAKLKEYEEQKDLVCESFTTNVEIPDVLRVIRNFTQMITSQFKEVERDFPFIKHSRVRNSFCDVDLIFR
jgi:hypothetical protein